MRILRGSFALGFGEAVSKLALFAFTAYFARRVGLTELAHLSVAQSLLMYATVVGDAGLTAHAVRRIAAGDRVRVVVRETSSVQLVLAMIGLAIVVPISCMNAGVGMTLALVLAPLGAAAAPTYLLQARGNMSALALGRVTSAVVTAGLGIAILSVTPTLFAAFAYSAGSLAAFLAIVWLSHGSLRLYFTSLTPKIRPDWMYASRWLIVQALVVHAYASCLTIGGSYLLAESEFVILSTALRIQMLLLIPANILQTVLLPLFVRHEYSILRVFLVTVGASIFVPLVVFISGESILEFVYGGEAGASAPALMVLSLQIPLAYGATVVLTSLVAEGAYGRTTTFYVVALIVQIVSLIALARGGATSSAISLLISESLFLALLCALRVSRKGRSNVSG
ncbi:oligosaccharide flippase family protein [Rhodococcus coprophilus]|uniref:Polysaccharide biosynthesis protein n=1 Tax=Rhodococcus coprophilus TaxID=38310 RepID=A0A2X4X8V8_9NOCA|nr:MULTISPECIES: oligosaccharide flippase family protein [Rhodococcus]MBM7459457.1 O-antigen/teichoic acid export membrane protein [Rhodococcus coprophilus]NME77907.1 oligosaccharide flippase family protein [Rhodococcus sp. 105337]SQI36125.1 Polysaccharide biosynthesis protein [Rhodococcus coprophilus]